MSNARSSDTVASTSSFSLSQAGSLTRMSIDSVLASAARPRGCSAPLTQTSNGTFCANSPKPGPACAGISPTNSANSPCGWRIMYVQAGLPPFISGRPGQRSELITAVDGRSSVRRWSARLTVASALATSGCGVSLVAALGSGCGAAGVALSTEPSTAFGR